MTISRENMWHVCTFLSLRALSFWQVFNQAQKYLQSTGSGGAIICYHGYVDGSMPPGNILLLDWANRPQSIEGPVTEEEEKTYILKVVFLEENEQQQQH